MSLTRFQDSEAFLKLIDGWEDPNPAPILESHDGVIVVRDDLLPAGSKSRFIDYLIGHKTHVEEWVYGSSPRVGFGQISLAYVASKYGKKSTVFVAKGKQLHPNSERAVSYGANVIEVGTGFLKVTQARAREYVAQKPNLRYLAPFGLADDTVFGCIIKVARSLPFIPDEVWTVAGSGTMNRGLQMAWPSAKCYMVSVGHELTAEERGRGEVIRHYLKFEQPCKKNFLPPFPSVINYDAKAWQYINERADKTKKVLFWNVGA